MTERPVLRDNARRLISKGSHLAGGAASAALGAFAGDPIMAAAFGAGGVVITQILDHLGNEVSERYLGEREAVRIGASMAVAVETIRRNLESGKQFRQDDFFDSEPSDRSSAEEVFEGVLLVAQREHEERKIQYYGRLVGNIAFYPEVGREEASLLIRHGERLSYQQLKLLSLFARGANFSLRSGDYRGRGRLDRQLIPVLQEIYDLHLQALVALPNDTLLGLTDVNPAGMVVQGVGTTLYELMELAEMPMWELEGLAAVLR